MDKEEIARIGKTLEDALTISPAGCGYLGDELRSAIIASAGRNLQIAAHHASVAAGWWTQVIDGGAIEVRRDLAKLIRNPPDGDVTLARALVAQKLCLIHSEISEAMEGHRKGLMDDKLPQYPMVIVELADAMIRIGDLAGALIPPDAGYNLGDVIAAKMAFNSIRPDHKPEARAAAGGKSY